MADPGSNVETPTHPLPTARTKERTRTPAPDDVDVAIVGAGTGGLCAGLYLARRGLRVALFDSHYVAGGSATQFARGSGEESWRFDIGLHYVGEVKRTEPLGAILHELGVELEWVPLDPDGFDTFHFPDFEFRMPADVGAYRDRLVALFPSERAGIDRYIAFSKHVHQARLALIDNDFDFFRPAVGFRVLTRAWRVIPAMNRTLGTLLDSCTRDPKLRALLAAQQGNYGAPPSEVSALLHCGVGMHYLGGAWYPRGGGQRISDAMADGIEAAGGKVCLRRGVERILFEGGRAVGVRLEADRGGKQQEVRARAVLSNADLKRTMLDLVGVEHLRRDEVRHTRGATMASALYLTCLGLRGEVDEIGLRAANIWQFDGYDFDHYYAHAREHGVLPIRGCYITSAAAKDPHGPPHAPKGHTTVEVMALVPGAASAWGAPEDGIEKRRYRHEDAYQQLKQSVEDELIRRFVHLVPGAEGRITFRESATPVTQSRYTRSTDGGSYGLAPVPAQYNLGRPNAKTRFPGLYLCGASTRAGHGIVGTLIGGRIAARAILDGLR